MFNIPPSLLVQHLINGITLGGIYALIALGYTMVYGILKFINFAHGEILMVGTYMGLFVYNALGASGIPAFIMSLAVAMCCSAALGIIIEKLAYKPLRGAPRLAPLLSAIGVSIILTNLAAIIFGTKSKRYAYPFDNTPIQLGEVSITPHQIMIIAVCLFFMVLLKLFIDRSKLGKAMRATSQNQQVAQLMGININFIISLTFAIGSSLAAVAGVLVALDYKAYPTMGMMAGLKAFIAAVVGGIGNVTGAILGGFLLGILETFGVAIFGIPQGLKDTIAFSFLIVILLVRPVGLLGKQIREKV